MSAWLHALHFLRPHWLWMLAALPLLWTLWRVRRGKNNVWHGVVDAHLLPHLLEHGSGTTSKAIWLGVLGYLLAALALAGPSWRQSEQPLWQSQAPLVIALDLSSTVTASDLPPSRLLQVRSKLATLLHERVGGQVALVVYAGEAFTVAPLTDDAANVALFLDALEPGVMPVDGQQPAKAIAWSVRLLQQAGFERGDILLLSDHSDAAASRAAAKAATQGFRVSVLGVGTASGAPYRDGEGRILHAALDPASLMTLAAAGEGQYQAISAGQDDLRGLGVLDPQAADGSTTRGQKGLSARDEGYWLLPVLMLLSLFAFRRGGTFATLAFCMLVPFSSPAQAVEGSLWKRADQQRHELIQTGADAYHRGKFADAEKSFAAMTDADGFYNQGNALAKQGRYDEAIAAYDKALHMQPGMQDAIANRKAVDAARKRKSSGGQKNQDQDKQGKSGQRPYDKGNKAGQPDSTDGKNNPDPPPAAKPRGSQQNPATPMPQPPVKSARQQAEEAKAQQAADAAQRQRMQQAMANAGRSGNPGDSKSQPGRVPVETALQRERRQAIDATLRRVPDEPGGLLKTKFRIEYERRQKEGL